jgi:hypothetical protein
MGILGISLLTSVVYSDYCVETFFVYAGSSVSQGQYTDFVAFPKCFATAASRDFYDKLD